MPRYDVYKRFRGMSSWAQLAYRSGFWAVLSLGPIGSGHKSVGIRAWIADLEIDVDLGRIACEEPQLSAMRTVAARVDRGGPLVAICMATFNPRRDQLQRQIDSIRGQSHPDWICVVSDDSSDPAAFEVLQQVIGRDDRFHVYRQPQRMGFYRNFESCLARVPDDAEYVALADQDDRWHPDKLATLLSALVGSKATLAYSDLRVVDNSGRARRGTFWRLGRPNNLSDLGRLVCFNTVTGAASLLRRDVVDAALPFPSVRGQFHDHWLACVALSLGDLAYVDRPLHEYVQHGQNVQGHRGRWLRAGASGGRTPQEWYFSNTIGAIVFSRELLARFTGVLTGEKRRALERIADLDSRAGFEWIVEWLTDSPLETRPLKLSLAALWRLSLSHLPAVPNPLLTVTRSAMPASFERY